MIYPLLFAALLSFGAPRAGAEPPKRKPRLARKAGAAPLPPCAAGWLQYVAEDFPRSEFVPTDTGEVHEGFAPWAAEAANTAAANFEGGMAGPALFEEVAKGRRIQANRKASDFMASYFGVSRLAGAYGSGMHQFERYPKGRGAAAKVAKLANARLAELGPAKQHPPNDVVTLSGDVLKGGALSTQGSHSVQLLYVNNLEAAKIMEDVYARLELLRSETLTGQEKREHFLLALYGYYNAVPYYRGSSAIGRVAFAGIFQAAFGKKLPLLEDGIDMIGILLTREQFLKRYLKTLPAADP